MRVLIVGAGFVGKHLAEYLSNRGVDLSVVELRQEKCREVTDISPNIKVFCGSGDDEAVLKSAEVDSADIVYAVTDDDDVNIRACKIAKKHGVPKVVALVNSMSRLPDYVAAGADVTISPLDAILSEFEKTFSTRTDVTAFLCKREENWEVVSIKIPMHAEVVGKKIAEIKLPPEARVSMIIRGNELIFPDENYEIHGGDEVLVVGSIKAVDKTVSILRSAEAT